MESVIVFLPFKGNFATETGDSPFRILFPFAFIGVVFKDPPHPTAFLLLFASGACIIVGG